MFYSGCNKTIIDDEENSNRIESPSNAVVDSTLGFVVQILDSTLYFRKAEDLLAATQVLKNLSSDKRKKWEESVGFVSAQTVLEEINAKANNIEDQKELETFIVENKEFIKAAPNDVNGIKSRIYGYYPYITSKRGFFVCESIWGRVFDGKLYSTPTYDYKGYFSMCKLSESKELVGDNVKEFILDFNEEEDVELKSHLEEEMATDTKIVLWMYNYGTNAPTKRAKFVMEIVNTYGLQNDNDPTTYTTVSEREDIYAYYFYVGYDGNCCTPEEYTYYYAPFGGTQRFIRVGNGWRIRVPYPGYFDSNPFEMDPNWDTENYYQELLGTTIWYNYFGRADLACTFQAQRRTIGWHDWDGTVLYIKDVVANFKVGSDVSGRFVSTTSYVGKLCGNYYEKKEEGEAKAEGPIYIDMLTRYRSQPPVIFKGCVSGMLYAQFCPLDYNFSYNY